MKHSNSKYPTAEELIGTYIVWQRWKPPHVAVSTQEILVKSTWDFCTHVLRYPDYEDLESVSYYVMRPEFSSISSSYGVAVAETWLNHSVSLDEVKFYFRHFCWKFGNFDDSVFINWAREHLTQQCNVLLQVVHKLPLHIQLMPDCRLEFSLMQHQ